MLEREGLLPVDDPIQQLQLVAAEILRLHDIFGDMVEDLPSWTTTDASGREDLRAVLRAFERSQDRSARVLLEMVKLDLPERLAKLTAAQGTIMIRLIEAVILADEMALTQQQIQTAKAIVAREIPRVSTLPAAELTAR
jgi:hypothetical protein